MPSVIRYSRALSGQIHSDDTLSYKYDSMGNITEVLENGLTAARYEYDTLGRLTREDNKAFGKTYRFVYDNKGNILVRYEYPFASVATNELNFEEATEYKYRYEENSDRLAWHTEGRFYYNSAGTPLVYCGKTLTWNYGRELAKFDNTTFEYNARGQRTGKNDITYTYDSDGKLLIMGRIMRFLYDHTGLFAFEYDGATYYYRKNAQNDVIALLDNTGEVVVQYKYDAWGNHKVLDVNGNEITSTSHIGHLNPFRYRSYFYDTETGLYYLKSRYYDPKLGRFISPDDISYLDPSTVNGLNLYAYCNNNPVMYADPGGYFGILATLLISTIVGIAIGAGKEIINQVYNDGNWNFDLKTWNWYEIGKEAIIGAATGFAYGLGGVAGGVVKGSLKALTLFGKTLSISKSVGFLLGTAAVTNFIAGEGSYLLNMIETKSKFNIVSALSEGVRQTNKGLLSFFTAGMFVSSKMWNVGSNSKNNLTLIIGRALAKFFANYIPNYTIDNLYLFYKGQD